ncbi:50S ribosomal protein L23 [Candidatus Woesearchaeota archaeon]|nr:50S ribosomal protein L23 [Candidatus Woesearchaeota archaeon]
MAKKETVKKGREEKQLGIKAAREADYHKVLLYPLSTEKSIRQIEFDNKLSFVVSSSASKQEVKKAVETMFKVKVAKVNMQNSIRGEKRATVKLTPQFLASDVSADLGLI